MVRFPGMDSLAAVLLAVRWSGVIGNAVAILVVLAILVATHRGMLMSFKDKLRARRAKQRDARRRKDLLVKSVRTLLLPAFIDRGFAPCSASIPQHNRPKVSEDLSLWAAPAPQS